MSSLVARGVTGAIAHSERWGAVWFGLLFWGSVLRAVAMLALADADPWLVAWAAHATGLAIGLVARMRGGWL
ncbi:MAG TPA: hypothetical protein VLA56_22555 [Pseudomonadales bacterium]|nr:hypothetical protein [Pseudomonadales bacterium]